MTDTTYHHGKRRWIMARAEILVRMHRMTWFAALEKARVEFDRFAKLDAKRPR